MTEIRSIRRATLPEVADLCERCGTPLVLMTWEVFDMVGDELKPAPTPERQWYEYEWFTIPETGQKVMRSFRPHTPERCTKARNPGSEPCESCGTPIARREARDV